MEEQPFSRAHASDQLSELLLQTSSLKTLALSPRVGGATDIDLAKYWLRTVVFKVSISPLG